MSINPQLDEIKIAVTGANGYIGSSLVRRLNESGVKVIRILRRESIILIEDWPESSNDIDRSNFVAQNKIMFSMLSNRKITSFEDGTTKLVRHYFGKSKKNNINEKSY